MAPPGGCVTLKKAYPAVPGGTSGIGRAAAEELVKKNGHVVVTGRRAEKGMK